MDYTRSARDVSLDSTPSDDSEDDEAEDDEEENALGKPWFQQLCWCLCCPMVRGVASCFYSFQLKQWFHKRDIYAESLKKSATEEERAEFAEHSTLEDLKRQAYAMGFDYARFEELTDSESDLETKRELATFILSEEAKIAKTTREIMLKLDFLCKFGILNVYDTCQKHQPNEDIAPPETQSYFEDDDCHYIPEVNTWIPKDDEQSSSLKADSSPSEKIEGKKGVPEGMLTKSKFLSYIPINDSLHPECYFEDDDVANRFSKDVVFANLHLLRSHGRFVADASERSRGQIFSAPTTDKAQGDIAYFGIGQVLLKRSNRPDLGEHMVDLCHMSAYRVRDAFEKYGACAYFKYPSKEITAIYWSHEELLVMPQDKHWNHAKWVWRCSLFLWVTAVDHLTHSHWIVSNALSSSLRGLPIHHPIRLVMHVATFGNAKVNSEAYMALYPRNGVLHNGTGLEWEGGLKQVFIDASSTWAYQSFPDRCKSSDLTQDVKNEVPLYTCALAIWQCMHRFLWAYVSLYYASDAAVQEDDDLQTYWKFECVPQYSNGLPPLSLSALVDQLTDAFFHVSVYHQIVGDVVRYLKRADNMCWQIRKGYDRADARAFTICLIIACRTNRDMPEFADGWFFQNWKEILKEAQSQQNADACVLLDKFQKEMTDLIGELNRKTENMPGSGSLRPEIMACSVSV